MCGNALLRVLGERFKVERPLVAEAVVHALAPDLHRLDQVAGRGGGKALRPEDGHGSFQHFVAIEFSWPHHGWHLTLLWTDMSITIGRRDARIPVRARRPHVALCGDRGQTHGNT